MSEQADDKDESPYQSQHPNENPPAPKKLQAPQPQNEPVAAAAAVKPDPAQQEISVEQEQRALVSEETQQHHQQHHQQHSHHPPQHDVFQHPRNDIANMHSMSAMAQYYEARMRDHAAAYATAAAGAAHAWAAAAQIAHHSTPLPAMLPVPPEQLFGPPMYPASANATATTTSGAARDHDDYDEERPVKRLQRTKPEQQSEKRGRRRPRDYSSSSDGGGGVGRVGKYHRSGRNKKQQRETNLVGKTGISALHEWTVKRKKDPPKFILLASEEKEFIFSALVDDLEWSRGKGATKGAAKQDAARKALMALLPGVAFDKDDLLIIIHEESTLPNLAQRLAISSKKRKPTADYNYPSTATSTTSEEDEQGRGASACSALLHAMWQIQEIPEPPSYVFSGNDDIIQRPSSFCCTATLNLAATTTNDGDKEDIPNTKLVQVGTGATKREARHIASAKLLAQLFPDCEGMAEVKAAAEAARERYAASRLVKQHAKRGERRKNEYSNADCKTSPAGIVLSSPTDPELPQSIVRYIRSLMNQEPPQQEAHVMSRLPEDEISVESLTSSLSLSENVTTATTKKDIPSDTTPTDSNARACSRQLQLEEMVEAALQTFNEYDEEGRKTPHEANFDDVGRTVLRLAEGGDARFIYKLLWGKGGSGSNNNPSINSLSPLEGLSCSASVAETYDPNDGAVISSRFWGPLSVTILLCRAIAPYDEPPLGCVVLTLGFSLTGGRLLRVAEIGSEPHLPQERFLECLDQFAGYMQCTLERKSTKGKETLTMTTLELGNIVESFLSGSSKSFLRDESASSSTLQAVKEEEPEVEEDKESSNQKTAGSAKDNKPSKRTRIG